MKFSSTIIAKKSVLVKSFKVFALAAFISSTVACSNYTVAPVCNKHNGVSPPGLTGTYTLSLQNEDFSTTTQEFDIRYSNVKGQLLITEEGKAVTASSLCSVNGYFVQETFNEDIGYYSQERLMITGMGLSFSPIFFDRNELVSAGVRVEIIEVPAKIFGILALGLDVAKKEGFSGALSKIISDVTDPIPALIINNSNISSNVVFASAKTGPASLNLLRK